MIKQQNTGDSEFLAVVCNTGANAGADVETQNLQPQSQRLPEDLPVSEVAADGGTARYALFFTTFVHMLSDVLGVKDSLKENCDDETFIGKGWLPRVIRP